MLKAGDDASSQIGMVTAATPCKGMLIARAIETSNLSQCFISTVLFVLIANEVCRYI